MHVIEVWRQTVENVHIKSWVCMGLLEKKVLKSGLKQGNTTFFQKVESRKLYVFHIHLVYLLDKKIFGYKRRCVILLRRWYQKNVADLIWIGKESPLTCMSVWATTSYCTEDTTVIGKIAICSGTMMLDPLFLISSSYLLVGLSTSPFYIDTKWRRWRWYGQSRRCMQPICKKS